MKLSGELFDLLEIDVFQVLFEIRIFCGPNNLYGMGTGVIIAFNQEAIENQQSYDVMLIDDCNSGDAPSPQEVRLFFPAQIIKSAHHSSHRDSWYNCRATPQCHFLSQTNYDCN
jgi:hypothetical protein